jgi:ribonuclease P protein component
MVKAERLGSTRDFEAVFTNGKSWANNMVVLRALPNSLGSSRCGFAVGKRLGGAVVRNRVRRRLREVVRHVPIEGGWDMVLVARKGATETDYHTLSKATEELLARGKLIGSGER